MGEPLVVVERVDPERPRFGAPQLTFFSTLLATAAAFTFLCTPDAAAVTGSVSGCVTFDDQRDQGSASTGSRRVSNAGTQPLRRVMIQVVANGVLVGSSATDYDTGCYTASYNDPFTYSFPTSGWKLRIRLENDNDFIIKNATGSATFVFDTNVTLNDNNETRNLSPNSAGDEVQVFQTVAEQWDTVVDNSTVLSSRMVDLEIRATVSATGSHNGCPEDTSCTIDRNLVSLIDGRGESRPITSVAHEVGHIVTLNGLDINQVNSGFCLDFSHAWESNEPCEIVSWHEGMANFWALTTQWTKDAPDANVFFGSTDRSAGTPEAACSSNGFETEACHTCAMWDMYDDPSGDDDAVDGSPDMTVATIVNILDQYTNGSADRQNHEFGEDGQNQHDFLENLDDLLDETTESHVRSIYINCGVTEGSSPYGSF